MHMIVSIVVIQESIPARASFSTTKPSLLLMKHHTEDVYGLTPPLMWSIPFCLFSLVTLIRQRQVTCMSFRNDDGARRTTTSMSLYSSFFCQVSFSQVCTCAQTGSARRLTSKTVWKGKKARILCKRGAVQNGAKEKKAKRIAKKHTQAIMRAVDKNSLRRFRPCRSI
jgi:hypothetical protein